MYWASQQTLNVFATGTPLGEITEAKVGLQTGDNERFLRQWFEVSADRSYMRARDREDAKASGTRWFPYNKGGEFRRWCGNQDYVINWEGDGSELCDFRPRSVIRNPEFYFRPCVSWSNISSGSPSFRHFDERFMFDQKGQALFSTSNKVADYLLSFLNSSTAEMLIEILSPTVSLNVGEIWLFIIEGVVGV